MSARDAILARVRLARSAPPAPPPAPWQRTRNVARELLVPLLTDRLRAYGVQVRHAATGTIAATAAAILRDHAITSLVLPHDLPQSWRPAAIAVREDGPARLDPADIETAQGAMTGARLGIAETGTIVMDGGPQQGRRLLTLLPDFHLCVLQAAAIVAIVPEAITALAAAAREGRPIIFISGPSATADIELERVQGVHGPRRLAVIIADA